MAVETEKITVKNMVCNRCVRVVREELVHAGFNPISVVLGEVTLLGALSSEDKQLIADLLNKAGFELIDDRRKMLTERIKSLIINKIHHNDSDELETLLFSKYLSETMAMDYGSISSLFSSIEGITVEKFVILQKIERVKELLAYGQLTLSEIAYRLGYSSSQHLSNQFRKTTGMTPTDFKRLVDRPRRPIDSVISTNKNNINKF